MPALNPEELLKQADIALLYANTNTMDSQSMAEVTMTGIANALATDWTTGEPTDPSEKAAYDQLQKAIQVLQTQEQSQDHSVTTSAVEQAASLLKAFIQKYQGSASSINNFSSGMMTFLLQACAALSSQGKDSSVAKWATQEASTQQAFSTAVSSAAQNDQKAVQTAVTSLSNAIQGDPQNIDTITQVYQSVTDLVSAIISAQSSVIPS